MRYLPQEDSTRQGLKLAIQRINHLEKNCTEEQIPTKRGKIIQNDVEYQDKISLFKNGGRTRASERTVTPSSDTLQTTTGNVLAHAATAEGEGTSPEPAPHSKCVSTAHAVTTQPGIAAKGGLTSATVTS